MKEEKKEPMQVIQARHFGNVFDGTESAEFVIQDLLNFCGFQSDGFSSDPYETAYNAGRRSVFLYLTSVMQLNELQVAAKLKIDNILNKEFVNSSDYNTNTGGWYDGSVMKGDK